jgi:signal transduction histidine kinase
METITGEIPQAGIAGRTQQLFDEHKRNIHVRTDHLFMWLMPLQWLAGIVVALWVSPRLWEGSQSSVHPHVWAAVFLGGAITFWPVLCAIKWPGEMMTRQMIAVGQMMMSALLIHLSGGRIETHFHIFGSLAFLACYRDTRVLISASIVVAVDHFVRGVYFPLSVFGTLTASPYRWLEHVWWVVFEDFFLIISIRQSLKEMLDIAQRQAGLEAVKADIERQVAERTAELTEEIAERKQAEANLEKAHGQLLETSRRAGMAEVATSVLHNVGNVLNSLNISFSVISAKVKGLRIGSVAKTAELLQQHADDLPAFFTTDPRGQKLPEFLGKLADWLCGEQKAVVKELELLGQNVGHIKGIIAVQQNYGNAGAVYETLPISVLVEDALRMSVSGLARHGIEVVREFKETPPMEIDKHKALQILMNLMENAKHALRDCDRNGKRIVVRTWQKCQDIIVSVSDNGVGIPAENLTRIFAHGFTTRKGGHGFGLHSGALAAREMGGDLTVESGGADKGATFTLKLPMQGKKMTKVPDAQKKAPQGLFKEFH